MILILILIPRLKGRPVVSSVAVLIITVAVSVVVTPSSGVAVSVSISAGVSHSRSLRGEFAFQTLASVEVTTVRTLGFVQLMVRIELALVHHVA